MSDDEMLRLACIYAERDQEALLDAWANVDDAGGRKVRRQTEAFLKKLRAYRLKRWGRTQLEKFQAEAKEVPVEQMPRDAQPNED